MAVKDRVLAGVVVATALGAGIAMRLRAEPMESFVDFTSARTGTAGGAETWELTVKACGDEVFDEIRVESTSPDLKVLEPSRVLGMGRGAKAGFRLELSAARAQKLCGVRITRTGGGRTHMTDFGVGNAP